MPLGDSAAYENPNRFDRPNYNTYDEYVPDNRTVNLLLKDFVEK